MISPFRLEELTNRLASLQQENKVLKIELETYKLKCKALQEENRDLRKASVTIVSGAPPLAPPQGHPTWGEGIWSMHQLSNPSHAGLGLFQAFLRDLASFYLFICFANSTPPLLFLI